MLQVFFRADQKYDLGRTNMKKKKKYIHPIIVVTFVYIFYTLNVMTIMRYIYIFTTIWGTEYKYTSDFIFKRKKETGRVLSLTLGCFSTEY